MHASWSHCSKHSVLWNHTLTGAMKFARVLSVSLRSVFGITLPQKATMHQVTTMLATSEHVLFPGHNHRYWWPDTLIITQAPASRWLWPENMIILEMVSMVAIWWIVFFAQCHHSVFTQLVSNLSRWQLRVYAFILGKFHHNAQNV